MKTTESMSVQEYKLRRAYDRAVKRWRNTMRRDGDTHAAWQEVHAAGECLKAFFADRNREVWG